MEMLSGGETRGGGSALGGAFYPTAMSLFFHLVVILFGMIGVNRLLPKRYALTRPEMATLYAMLTLGTAVAGVDMLQVLVPMTAYPTWFASTENDWQNLFERFLPTWWVVRERSALEGFYVGGNSLYVENHLRVWVPVVGAWMAFLTAMLIVFGCLTVLVRRQWIEHERLTYPVVQLPLALLEGNFWKSGGFWGGFSVMVAVTLYNGVAYLVPALPLAVWWTNVGTFFRESPWNAIGWTPFRLFPFVIAMVFLIPQELSFSGWFFYWLAKGLRVFGAAVGVRGLPEFPYVRQQSFGAYVGIFAFAMFSGRHYFLGLWREARRGASRDPQDPLSMRTALGGGVLGILFLMAFSVKAGLSGWVAAAFFGLYFVLATGIARIRAELGAPVHDLHFMGPERVLVFGVGSRRLGAQNLSLLSMFYWFNRAYRCLPMPAQLEGLKLAQAERFEARGLFWALLVGGVLGGLSVWWILLDAFYRQGGLSGIASYAVHAFGKEPFARLESWLTFPTETDIPALVAVLIGYVVTTVLLVLRTRFVWWPLHPLGYCLADDYAMNWIWSSVLVGWALKVGILHGGGIRAYRSALPLFLGLLMGEFTGGCFWSVVNLLTGRPMYAFKNW